MTPLRSKKFGARYCRRRFDAPHLGQIIKGVFFFAAVETIAIWSALKCFTRRGTKTRLLHLLVDCGRLLWHSKAPARDTFLQKKAIKIVRVREGVIIAVSLSFFFRLLFFRLERFEFLHNLNGFVFFNFRYLLCQVRKRAAQKYGNWIEDWGGREVIALLLFIAQTDCFVVVCLPPCSPFPSDFEWLIRFSRNRSSCDLFWLEKWLRYDKFCARVAARF